MTRKKTVHQAISEVLQANSDSMAAEDIYHAILKDAIYIFPAKDPLSVVRSTLRRHCVNRDFPTARRKKYFSVDDNGNYTLLPEPVIAAATAFRAKPKGASKNGQVISMPIEDEDSLRGADTKGVSHDQIQWRLLNLGKSLGMNVWAPKNDRGRSWEGKKIGDVPGMLDRLPQQFDKSAMELISYIDVIWLHNRALFAAFEVEHSTPIYSGLLRMADLMPLVPNQDIQWYVVSAEERFDKFTRQVTRPLFQIGLKKPLHSVCRFIPYERLLVRLDEAKNVIEDLRPTFIEKIAESYDPEDAFAN